MKRIVQILMVAVMVATASGQGTFIFSNGNSSLVRYQTEMGSSVLAPVPVFSGRVEVLWATVGTTDLNLFQIVGPAADIYFLPGRFSGGTRTVPGLIPPGGLVDLVIRGWVGPANTWAEAVSGGAHMYGYSSIFRVDTADPWFGGVAETPPTIATFFPGLDLYFVPEPSSYALVAVGLLFLVIRRNKRLRSSLSYGYNRE